jgi:ATP-binding cassette subfamily B (MDR/TAP) protein 1
LPLIVFISGITKAQSAANRMQYMERKRAPINSSTGLDPLKLSEKEALIEFRDVRFRYPSRPDVEVLRGIDMKIHPGENICIVGPSGCGKSTIISLLERFYDISSGEILINRTILSNLDIHAFRSTLGLVSQETSLFQGTIRENLCLSVDGDIDDETLMSACKNANIHDFIASLPDGYATECGSRGLALSGGQRQRIAIARTLLRNPRILLLDEATSALDPESQRLVIDALEKASTGRTMISLSHQVEVMKQADRIFVVEHGVIVESGSYESLLSQRGRFSEMLGELVDDG